MRILIATGLYPPESGGPATYTRLLEQKLPERGFVIHVLPFRRVRHLPKVLRHIAYFFACMRLGLRADVVYALDTVSVGLPAALASMCVRKKFLLRVPGDYAWEQARQRFGVKDELDDFQHKTYGLRVELLRSVQKFVARRATAIVVPSEYMRRIVRNWDDKNDENKIQVIYSSIEMPQVEAAKREKGFLVLSSGRRVPWKGFEAVERVVAREDGWRFMLIENMLREEALRWVKTADVFVLNSTYEGLSHALVEAMMLGTPVVATRIGGNPELIEDGVDGLLVPPKDDEALYRALKQVHSDPAGAQARAERAKEKVKAFSIDVAIGKLAELLQTI